MTLIRILKRYNHVQVALITIIAGMLIGSFICILIFSLIASIL